MGRSSSLRLAVLVLALMGMASIAIPEAKAVTYGEEDCVDNSTNTGCLHPNTVSLSGFRLVPLSGDPDALVSAIRCSGSLLSKDDEMLVILTAGHCASSYLSGLQNGSLVEVGVSFDAEIVRDRPDISPTVWSPNQYVLGGQPVLPAEYGPQGAKAFNVQFDYAVVMPWSCSRSPSTDSTRL